jgi:hypothetical protein
LEAASVLFTVASFTRSCGKLAATLFLIPTLFIPPHYYRPMWAMQALCKDFGKFAG